MSRRHIFPTDDMATWEEIGAAFGVSSSEACRVYQRAMRKLRRRFGRSAAILEMLDDLDRSRPVSVGQRCVDASTAEGGLTGAERKRKSRRKAA